MKRIPRLLVSAALISLLLASPVQASRSPNVVIILTDDQGTLDANCYGSSDLHTPNIDELARTGVRFTQAYAHTVCCPSRAALLTGRHPQRGGVNSWTQGDINAGDGVNMALSEVTLAEALKTAGYQTALFGKWHLGAHRDFGPTRQGFDEFFGVRSGFIDSYNHYFLQGDGYHSLHEGPGEVRAHGKYFPELLANRCLQFIEQNQSQPFFLYAAFTLPHYPEQALERFEQRYADLDEMRSPYAAVVSSADYYIGQILDKLDSLNLRNNTIVIFMSDNGHNYPMHMHEWSYIQVDDHPSGLPKGHYFGASGGGNTGKWIGYKGTFLEGGVRVPAIISYPGVVPEGQVRNQAVTVMDWYPTVLEYCAVEKPQGIDLDGRSLTGIIESADSPSPREVLHFQWQKQWAVRQGEWKLIFGRPKEALVGGKDRKMKLTLHNLNDTQPEVKDYAADRPEIVNRLRRIHEAWAEEVMPGERP